MSDTTTRRQSISFTSILAFLAGGFGASLVLLLCYAVFLSGCKTLGVVTRNNGEDQETCFVIKAPSALRICLDSIPQPDEPQ
jgi:hypothetical protein